MVMKRKVEIKENAQQISWLQLTVAVIQMSFAMPKDDNNKIVA